ncbi:hypothetical protein [uncultured Roseobacter sp.]|uniref:hypothetical protein n=1 Tax=uncultured Roseobacter sp. TaxID=114847 RepID=UPI0026194EE6|nr:hypothetical protein [uncultured Roseobacter sp.]
MANPIINRSANIDGITLFPEADDSKLYYYGVSARWGELSISHIGDKYEVIHGEIDFSPDPEVLEHAKSLLGADRLLPIPIDFIDSDLKLAFELGENHVDESSIVNTLPFPRFLLRVTIDLDELTAEKTSARIQEGWGDYEHLLEGDTIANMSGLSLVMSLESNLSYQDIYDEITAHSTNLRQTRRVLEGYIHAAFESNFESWVSIDPSGSNIRLVTTDFLTEKLFTEYSIEKEPLVRYDGGSVLNGFALREPSEVGNNFIVSERKTVPSSIALPAFGTADFAGSHYLIEASDAWSGLVVDDFDPQDGLDDTTAFEETHEESDVNRDFELRSWRPAHSLKILRQQLDGLFPARSKSSDGFIGDTNHCPGSSDHCPNILVDGVGVVAAFDCTHDPQNGCDMHVVTRAIANSRDKRVKYIIYNSKVCSSYPIGDFEAWEWRPYSGSNPHERHAHFSVISDEELFDSISSWHVTPSGQDDYGLSFMVS